MPDDDLTLTIRLHDPKEKENAEKSASWITAKVERADLELSAEDFAAKYITPELGSLAHLKKSPLTS